MLGGRGVGVGSPEKMSNRSKEFWFFSDETCDAFILDVVRVFVEFEHVFAHSLVWTVSFIPWIVRRKRILWKCGQVGQFAASPAFSCCFPH